MHWPLVAHLPCPGEGFFRPQQKSRPRSEAPPINSLHQQLLPPADFVLNPCCSRIASELTCLSDSVSSPRLPQSPRPGARGWDFQGHVALPQEHLQTCLPNWPALESPSTTPPANYLPPHPPSSCSLHLLPSARLVRHQVLWALPFRYTWNLCRCPLPPDALKVLPL